MRIKILLIVIMVVIGAALFYFSSLFFAEAPLVGDIMRGIRRIFGASFYHQ